MPRVSFTRNAALGLERCRRFLADKNPKAALRAAQAVIDAIAILESLPDIGRPHSELPDMRELLIPFGDSGYLALYRHDPNIQVVWVLAIRHQKEAEY